MFVDCNGVRLYYREEGEGIPLLLLHGWGCNVSHMASIQDHFKDAFRVIAVDIPGFGESGEPPDIWGTKETADCIAAFLLRIGAEKPVIAGHSNGGRIAIDLASRGLCRRLLLLDSAGIKPKRGMNYYLKVYSYKAMKKCLDLPGLKHKKEELLEKRRQSSGSADYQAASPRMRQVLSKVVNEDLTPLLARITVPTVLLWGAKDTATPLEDGKEMERILKKAGADVALIVFDGAGHYAFLEENARFLRVMSAFLEPLKEKTDVCL